MPKISNIIAILLVLGLIYAELLPNLTAPQVYSSNDNSPTRSKLLLSFFDPSTKHTAVAITTADQVIFIDNISDIPGKLIQIAGQSPNPIEVDYTISEDPLPVINEETPAAIIYQPSASTSTESAVLGDVIPPSDTSLFEAYAIGGRAWYQEGTNVIVIFPNTETLRSFNKTTGEETNWLQDRLQYAPLDTPGALENYLTNYHGEIVAETKTWALVKFPSGGFLKIAKPTTTSLESRPFFAQQ